MTFVTILAAALGYALIYAAAPNRDVLRARTRAGVRRPIVMGSGSALLLLSAGFGAAAIGPVTGPIVACAAAVAAGSVLVLIGPLFMRDASRPASSPSREGDDGEVSPS